MKLTFKAGIAVEGIMVVGVAGAVNDVAWSFNIPKSNSEALSNIEILGKRSISSSDS